MPKFVLIEPAIEGWTGHYYEYAVRVLRAAKAADYDPILAVNQVFQGKDMRDIYCFPVYRMGQRLVPKEFPLYYFARKLKNKLKSGLAARKPVSAHASARAHPQQNPILKDKPLRWLMNRTFGRYKIASFTRDTLALFQQITLEKDDIVFLPTASEYELHGLIAFFQRYPDFRNATWHLLFHSNIITESLSKAFVNFQQILKGGKIYFYTDTEQLTAQYNRLGILRFNTLPIPIDLGFSIEKKPIDVSRPLCVSYIGDARAEKGYQHLPNVVEKLLADYTVKNKIKFLIQSNFNIEEGEPAAIIARAKLEKFSGDHVRLLKNPLTPSEYRDLLLESDIVLFPYDSVAYASRSSGIFTEALVAGIPVVVPEGSWMALQMREVIHRYQADMSPDASNAVLPKSIVGMIYQSPGSIAECIAEIVTHYAYYRESAKIFSKAWSVYHNPATLLATLRLS
jgi:hypothetical protein